MGLGTTGGGREINLPLPPTDGEGRDEESKGNHEAFFHQRLPGGAQED